MFQRLITFLAVLAIPGTMIAQQLTNQDWQTENDYRAVEKIVLDNILWLENHPLATTTNDTKAITEYVLNWLSGAPYVSVTYDEIFLSRFTDSKKYKFGEKFRITYLFGKSYYLINNRSHPNEVNSCERGIEGMVRVYTALKKVDPSVRHAILEKYSRMVEKGRLASYVETRLDKAAKGEL